MAKPNHIPSYIFLLAEYVAFMEALYTYKTIPEDVRERMHRRSQELKAIDIEDLDAAAVNKEIVQAKKEIKNL